MNLLKVKNMRAKREVAEGVEKIAFSLFFQISPKKVTGSLEIYGSHVSKTILSNCFCLPAEKETF